MRAREFVKARAADLELASLKLAGLLPVHLLRVAMLRAWGAQISPEAVIYHGFEVRRARGLRVGEGTSIGDGAVLDSRGGLTFGSRVNVSTDVQFWTAQHDWRSKGFDYQVDSVTVGDYAWIGPRVVVLPGSVIGTGAVVAAGAIVSGEVAPYTLVGGVPAKYIADRPRDLDYVPGDRRRKMWWW